MKPLLPLVLAALTGITVSGCNRSAAQLVAVPEPAPAAVFKAGHGVQLSAAASATIGLATAEVGTRDVAAAKAVAAVPAAALLRTVRGAFVYVANGEAFLRTPVTLGATDGGWLEIASGLYEGDRVVTHGTRALWLAELQAVNGGVGCADGH